MVLNGPGTLHHIEETPIVSVVIPAYNVAQYIEATLDSVVSQNFSSYEIIVINDGSPDSNELERLLERYSEQIIYLKQQNLGPSAARNYGVLQARGEYVAFLDGDDLWTPDFLARQLEILHADPSLDLIYSDAELFGEGDFAGQTFMQACPSNGPVSFESLIGGQCSVITSCVVARRQSLIDAGLFDLKFLRAEDYDLWLRLAHRGGRITYQRQVLAKRRLHKDSLAADQKRMRQSALAVYEKLMNILILSPRETELIAQQISKFKSLLSLEEGKELLVAGHYQEAASAFKRANSFSQNKKLQLVIQLVKAAPWALRYMLITRQKFLYRRQAATAAKHNALTPG